MDLSTWDAVADRLEWALRRVSYALGTLALLILTGQVLTRFAFSYVPVWGNELSIYLMVWTTLLLLPVLLRDDDHLSVDVVMAKLDRRTQVWLRSAELFAIALFGLVFAYWGYQFAISTGLSTTSPGLDVQMFWVYVVMPVSGLLIFVFALDRVQQIHTRPDASVIAKRGFERE